MQIRPIMLISIFILLFASTVQNLEMRWELSRVRDFDSTLTDAIVKVANASASNSDSINKLSQALNGHTQARAHQDHAVQSLIASVRMINKQQGSLRMIFPPRCTPNFAPFPKTVYSALRRW